VIVLASAVSKEDKAHTEAQRHREIREITYIIFTSIFLLRKIKKINLSNRAKPWVKDKISN